VTPDAFLMTFGVMFVTAVPVLRLSRAVVCRVTAWWSRRRTNRDAARLLAQVDFATVLADIESEPHHDLMLLVDELFGKDDR
jgi:hypothetical protein